MKESNLTKGYILKGANYSYRIEGVLGQGSFGITYLATTKAKITGPLGTIETEVKVAVKEFFMHEFCSRREDGTITEMTEGSLVQNYSRKFRKEAENLAKLSHPGIVNVLEVFDANNTCYYAMQYIAGGSLDAYVKSRGGLPEDEAVECIRQIGEAVQYMHDHKMLHLDLKPGNVMRGEDGKKMVLIDFGLSKQYSSNGEPESSTTIGLGTPGYAPIEQSNADRDRDFAPTLDVYALGATFFKLLTGETPPKASDVLNEGLPIEKLRQKGVSPECIEAIECAMEPRKGRRLQDVKSFLNKLSAISSDEEQTEVQKPKPEPKPTPKPNPEPKPSKAQKSPEKKPSGFPEWLYGLFVVVDVVVLAVVLFNRPDKPSATDDSQIDSTVSSGFGINNGHEWVDLGLSVKWATCNVGASSPKGYGSYFAWGETSPKSKYTWLNLKYRTEGDSDNNVKFSKYVASSQYGPVDNKTRLDLSDDAARANWGGSWRMPTINEFQELIDKCTWIWTTMNGKNGCKVVSKSNGNSIFLPAAGWRYGTSLSLDGSNGCYWSSSLNESNSYYARYLSFGSGNHFTNYGSRSLGHSVRPVCP